MTMRVPKPKLLELVTGIRTDLNTAKTAQSVDGDSLQGFLSYSGNPNDYSFVIAAGATITHTLTFTNANAKYGALIYGWFSYSMNQPNVAANAVPPWANGPQVSMTWQKLTPTNTTNAWQLEFNNSGSTSITVYLSFLFSGTDTGTWSVS